MKIDSAEKATLFVVFLIVYGAVVFLLTRGYYKTEAPPSTVQTAAPQFPAGLFGGMPRDIPTSNLEIQKAGNDPVLLAQVGNAYFGLGQYSQAIQAYEKFLTLNPREVDIYNDLGLALHYTGRSTEAIRKLRQGTEVGPTYQRIWLSLGFVLASTNSVAEARVALNKARNMDSGSKVGQEAKRMLDQLPR
jgi:tetratricopeptide (TPR) repeat protein